MHAACHYWPLPFGIVSAQKYKSLGEIVGQHPNGRATWLHRTASAATSNQALLLSHGCAAAGGGGDDDGGSCGGGVGEGEGDEAGAAELVVVIAAASDASLELSRWTSLSLACVELTP